jgi:HPt (histidine-containing phosphotransfer) domain-containing protein
MFQVLEKLGRQSRGNQTLKGTRIMLKDQQKIQIMTPIFSDFLDEPGMPKIINMFLDEIPKRIAALEFFFNEDNKDEFCKMIHQLKGAGGGYGFPMITRMASGIEKKFRVPKKEWKQEVQKNLEDFISTLHRIHAGKDISGDT